MWEWIAEALPFIRHQPPRPTALELAEANQAAARERQRLIVEWLVCRAGAAGISPEMKAALMVVAYLIEAGEPLRAARPEGRLPGPRFHR